MTFNHSFSMQLWFCGLRCISEVRSQDSFRKGITGLAEALSQQRCETCHLYEDAGQASAVRVSTRTLEPTFANSQGENSFHQLSRTCKLHDTHGSSPEAYDQSRCYRGRRKCLFVYSSRGAVWCLWLHGELALAPRPSTWRAWLWQVEQNNRQFFSSAKAV